MKEYQLWERSKIYCLQVGTNISDLLIFKSVYSNWKFHIFLGFHSINIIKVSIPTRLWNSVFSYVFDIHAVMSTDKENIMSINE